MKLKIININEVKPNPNQPRTHIDKDELRELADSMKEHDLLQPIVVHKVKDGFEIIGGERRWRAMKLLKKDKIPAIVREVKNDADRDVKSLVENVQRTDLSEMEKGFFVRSIMQSTGESTRQLGCHIGVGYDSIQRWLACVQAPEPIQKEIEEGNLSGREARILNSFEPEEQQEILSRAKEESKTSGEIKARVIEIARNERLRQTNKDKIVVQNINEKYGGILCTALGDLLHEVNKVRDMLGTYRSKQFFKHFEKNVWSEFNVVHRAINKLNQYMDEVGGEQK